MKITTTVDLGSQEVTVYVSGQDMVDAIALGSQDSSPSQMLIEVCNNLGGFFNKLPDEVIALLNEHQRKLISEFFQKQADRFIVRKYYNSTNNPSREGRLTPENPSMDVQAIAVICHEANKSYCQGIGDYSQPAWLIAPQWQRDSAIKGVEFHLNALRSGFKPSPAASHESWMAEKTAEGWKYGEVKDPIAKTHPCYLPYDQLPAEQRGKDYLFAGIVEALFAAGLA